MGINTHTRVTIPTPMATILTATTADHTIAAITGTDIGAGVMGRITGGAAGNRERPAPVPRRALPCLPHERARRRVLIAATAPLHAAEAAVWETTARTPFSAACSAASLAWSSEVFITVPPSPRRPSRTLSVVARRTSTNR